MNKDVSTLSTKTKIILIIAAVVLAVGCCVGGYLLGKNYAENTEQKESR